MLLAEVDVKIRHADTFRIQETLKNQIVRHWIEIGYRQGGPAGYGLRRTLIDQSGSIKGELARGEHKSLQTDRVILVLVAGVESGSPAEAAGLQLGDQVIALDGKPIITIEDLLRTLDGASIGRELGVSVLRLEKRLELRVTPKESPV
jgi:S1-C subfamily serine protease